MKNTKTKQIQKNIIDSTNEFLTTNQGVKVNDNHNSLKSHARGATLLEDFIMREKLAHFDRERIPERVVHARGTGVFGVFKLEKSLKNILLLNFLMTQNQKLPYLYASLR
jgi:catalase